MRFAFLRTTLPAVAFGALLVAGSWSEAAAAQPKKKEEPQDSGPILMSRNGGGKTWANVNELRAAAEKGDPKAEAQFGEILLRGEEGVTQDRPRAIAMLEKAAHAGESSAAFRLGMLYDDGTGVSQDRPRAMAYFRAAAAGGAMEALHNIGAAYASARGVRRDYAEGLAWLMLAKKRGSESPAEQALRAQIQRQPRAAELVATAERRMAEIERELAGKQVTDLLPPELSARPSYAPAPSAGPAAPALVPVAPPASLPPPVPMVSPPVELPKVAPPVVP